MTILATRLPGHWAEQAACIGKPIHWWFPDSDDQAGTVSPSHYSAARRICGRCPVSAQCLEHAVTTPEPHGMWGGSTPRERRAMRVAGKKQAARLSVAS